MYSVCSLIAQKNWINKYCIDMFNHGVFVLVMEPEPLLGVSCVPDEHPIWRPTQLFSDYKPRHQIEI